MLPLCTCVYSQSSLTAAFAVLWSLWLTDNYVWKTKMWTLLDWLTDWPTVWGDWTAARCLANSSLYPSLSPLPTWQNSYWVLESQTDWLTDWLEWERICVENSNGCGYAKYSRSLGWLAGNCSKGWLDRVGQRCYSNGVAKYTRFRPMAFFRCTENRNGRCLNVIMR